ncbi:hypothetical protein [Actinophytocola gossypii]|uniref:hypothetical protein n=1 Tax=Actinophytocola gossypii TaxID=2812003 RepID=UPI0021A6B0C6|nr:hypothetical protein [Actinophytocola gossypii]
MLSDWWNGVELWVLGLAFPFQFALVMAVLLPLVLVVAYVIDRFVDHASVWLRPSAAADRPIRTAHPAPDQASSEDGRERVPEPAGR